MAQTMNTKSSLRCFSLQSLAVGVMLSVSAAAQNSSVVPEGTSYTLSPIVVEGRPGWLDEESLIGEYKRPEWTSRRRFGTTRVYVQYEPWEVAVEQWWRVRTFHDKHPRHLFMEEIAIGLPHRMQFDIYYDWAHENGRTQNKDVALELRWALADWDVIPLNPTLYIEYKATDGDYGADVWEAKLLLGDDITPRLHWAFNAVFEREISRGRANECALTQGISYTIIDQVLSAGVEMQYKYENEQGARQDGVRKFQIGPSIQYNPSRSSWINLVALFGCTHESPAVEGFVVIGHNFGRAVGGRSLSRPVAAPR